MCRMFDKTLNSVDVYNYKRSKTCRKVSTRERVRRNVHWFHQHNKHYNLHACLYSPSGTASLEFFFTLLWRRFKLKRLVATVLLTLTVLVNVVAMSPSNNRRLSVQLLLKDRPAGVVTQGGTPIHYLYGYVPPNGVVILKLLI